MQRWRSGAKRAAGPDLPDRQPANRLLFLAAAGLVWALAILFRLVQLQVVSHAEYKRFAEQQQLRTVPVDAPRGAILDRSGRPLALSVPVDSVCINPLRVPNRALAADLLAGALGVDRDDLFGKMEAAVAEHDRQAKLGQRAKGVGFLWVKRKITPEQSDALRAMKLDYVEFRKETQRYYPDGSLGSHTVGTVDFQERGNLGLEKALDNELRGRPGSIKMITDVQQRGVESLSETVAEPGATITLTIDERIQFVVERELKAACEYHHAASGSVVVMNPNTGEVLALASYPKFDPREPVKSGEDASVRFKNEPVSVAFEPGSVFKVITLSAALETTNLRPETPINCGGGVFRIAGRVIHEAKRGYGTLSMADVLAKSSNIGAIQVGLRVGAQNMLEYVRRFGFGAKTGVPLPAESGGRVVKQIKSVSTLASMSMGHEVSTTTLQLAQACSVIANGGVLVRPRIVLSRKKPGGKPAPERTEPPRRILKPETAITMRQLMEGVVLHGTGKAARLPGYTSGGKTGSAQIYDRAIRRYTHLYNGSFVGFAPVTNPAIVIAVTLNGTKLFGGVVAAPVFHNIAVESLRLLDVPRDLPETAPPAPPEREEMDDVAIADLSTPPDDLGAAPAETTPQIASAFVAPIGPQAPATGVPGMPAAPPAAVPIPAGPRVPSFQGKTVRAVVEESLADGVPVDVIGSGIARGQAPAPGAVLNPGERVRVLFR